MAENNEINKNKPSADPTPLLLAEVEVRDADPKTPHPKKSAGELAFDRIVYTGIGFGVNEASSLFIADEFEHGMGKKWFEKASDFLVKTFKIADKTAHNGKLITGKKSAGNLLMTAGLLTSGTLLLVPMKMLEDHKSEWVKKANHFIDRMKGNKLSAEEVAARDEEVEKAIACQPKQSWPSLLVGRLAAVTTTMSFSAAMGAERNGKLMDVSEKLLTGSIKSDQSSRLHRIARLGILETMYTTITSVVLEVSSKLFAKRGIEVHNPELCTAVVHEKESAADTTAIKSADKPEEAASEKVVTSAPEKTFAEKVVAEESLQTAAADPLEKYKKKAVLPMEKHTDLANSSNVGMSLAT